MKKEKLILEFDDDSLRSKVFGYLDIPKEWYEGDYISELDHYDILNAIEEAASYMEDDSFEDGAPGMSGPYIKVYTRDEAAFKQELTKSIIDLLKKLKKKMKKRS